MKQVNRASHGLMIQQKDTEAYVDLFVTDKAEMTSGFLSNVRPRWAMLLLMENGAAPCFVRADM